MKLLKLRKVSSSPGYLMLYKNYFPCKSLSSELCMSWCRMRNLRELKNLRLQPKWSLSWGPLSWACSQGQVFRFISVSPASGHLAAAVMLQGRWHQGVPSPWPWLKPCCRRIQRSILPLLNPIAGGVSWDKPEISGLFCQTQELVARKVCRVPVKSLCAHLAGRWCREHLLRLTGEDSLPSHQALPSIDSFC